MKTLIIDVTDSFKVPDSPLVVQDTEPGHWRVYSVRRSKIFLHERLSLEVATSLAVWEDLDKDVKITKSENDTVIGIALRR